MNQINRYSAHSKGFSLIELTATIAIAAIITGIAISFFGNFMNQKRIRLGTEELYNYIKIAQAQSYTNHGTVYLSFNPTTWCYGLSDTAPCDCTSGTACTVNGALTVVNSTNYSGSALSLTVTGFSSLAGTTYIQFDGSRGTIATSGTVSFGVSNLATTLTANTMGLVTICSNNVPGYQSC